MKSVKNLTTALALIISFAFGFSGCTKGKKKPVAVQPTATKPNSPTGGVNDPKSRHKPIVVMVSIDGFRYDYMEEFRPPHLNALAAQGVKAASLKPSFPSLTFPNHVTLVTGRSPGRHGIVSNSFFDEKRKAKYSIGDGATVTDGSWYLADTLWTIAEKNGMVSAVYFWVGSEAKIGGVDPTYFIPYDGKVPNSERVNQVIEWLSMDADKRPHFISLYFSAVDSAAHKYGSRSREAEKAVLEIDFELGRLASHIDKSGLDINLIVVSDHGMTDLDTNRVIDAGAFTDLSGFTYGDRGPVLMLYSEDEAKIAKAYEDLKAKEKNFTVYKRADVPKQYKFDHPDRVGDLVMVAEPPYYIFPKIKKDEPLRLSAATHGWDPMHREMHALFIAKGPQFKKGLTAPTFENVHIFPTVLKILGLETKEPHEGSLDVLAPYLAEASVAR